MRRRGRGTSEVWSWLGRGVSEVGVDVAHRLLVLTLERVVVTDDAARLGAVLVHLHATGVREARELCLPWLC